MEAGPLHLSVLIWAPCRENMTCRHQSSNWNQVKVHWITGYCACLNVRLKNTFWCSAQLWNRFGRPMHPFGTYMNRHLSIHTYTHSLHLFSAQHNKTALILEAPNRTISSQMDSDTVGSGSGGPIIGCNFSTFISFPARFVFLCNNGVSNWNRLQIMGNSDPAIPLQDCKDALWRQGRKLGQFAVSYTSTWSR